MREEAVEELLKEYGELARHFHLGYDHNGKENLWVDEAVDSEWGERADRLLARIKELENGNN